MRDLVEVVADTDELTCRRHQLVRAQVDVVPDDDLAVAEDLARIRGDGVAVGFCLLYLICVKISDTGSRGPRQRSEGFPVRAPSA